MPGSLVMVYDPKQVKTNRQASPVEREAIQLFNGLPANATKEVWIFHDYARAPVIKAIG
jgi:hypothetical protein